MDILSDDTVPLEILGIAWHAQTSDSRIIDIPGTVSAFILSTLHLWSCDQLLLNPWFCDFLRRMIRFRTPKVIQTVLAQVADILSKRKRQELRNPFAYLSKLLVVVEREQGDNDPLL